MDVEGLGLTIGAILAAMALVSVIELAIPLVPRGRWNRAHLAPNLALTFITFATNAFFNVALVLALAWSASRGYGLLPLLGGPAWLSAIVALVALDLSFYLAHVAMHKVPLLWRFHRVHHSDPAVDVTTTIRQHPGEGVARYLFLAAFAISLGVTPAAFAIYRVASALNAILEHANIRLPRRIDRAISFVTTWPNMHKIHHSRSERETDSNYGNLLSIWDRCFGTFTPADRAAEIRYGLDGFDDPDAQTTAALIVAPFRGRDGDRE
jgi:sterol desaturase/sphingolipid hydroxylase (fatty acid hydroxylase superfamily)